MIIETAVILGAKVLCGKVLGLGLAKASTGVAAKLLAGEAVNQAAQSALEQVAGVVADNLLPDALKETVHGTVDHALNRNGHGMETMVAQPGGEVWEVTTCVPKS